MVEDLTESERTYGKGIKTGADALAKCRWASAYAVEVATGVRNYNTSSRDWEVVEFRRITSQDSVCFIRPEANARGEFEIVGMQGGAFLFYAKGKPVYIVRPKQPRKKKRVLVFDFDDIQAKTCVLCQEALANCGVRQAVTLAEYPEAPDQNRMIRGTVEEREA